MSDSPTPYVRSPELLSAQRSKLLVVDVQEKLLPLIPVAEQLTNNCRRLIEGARILSVPTFVTEQYPKGLGGTVPELAALLPSAPSKVRFSCAEVLNWGTAADQPDERDQIVVAGMEAHVCVLQTVLDLLAQGFRVYVPADAVGSRAKLDWQIGLNRLAASGAVITTTESVLFEWCEVAGSPEFREISRLIRGQ
jgi:nicotinamidase-related amidase